MRAARLRGPRQLASILLAALAIAAGPAAPPGRAQGLALALQQIASGFDLPLDIGAPVDGTQRLFVAEKGGRIRIVRDGQIVATPFLDLSGLVATDANEGGLLGLAFHPDYAANGAFFVYYLEPEPSPPAGCPAQATCAWNSVLARYLVSDSDPDLADPASARILLRINQPRGNHNGGKLAFGPDGLLYVAIGDGGGAGDPFENAQNLGTLLGTILRLDVDAEPAAPSGEICGLDADYEVPADNPFVGVAGACDEIWAYGLRNPWRFGFDRETGDLFIGDVGQASIEEIDFQVAASSGGENYGWKCYEGSQIYDNDPPCAGPLVFPLLEHSHSESRSVTGGFRYRGDPEPRLRGVYLYGDFVFGKIWGALPRCDGQWESRLLLDTELNFSSFGEDEAGEIYVAEYAPATGKVHRLALAPESGGPAAGAAPGSLDFPPLHPGDSATLELTLSNDNPGPEALQISGMTLSDPARFSLDPGGGASPCGSTSPCLAPGASCTVAVSFGSNETGSFEETLKVTGNSAPLEVPLSGVAYLPCSSDDHRTLADEQVPDTRTEEACLSLATERYEILASGDATLRAGELVILRDGTVVRIGGQLTIAIDPLLTLP